MEWTKALPSKPGVYWIRFHGEGAEIVVCEGDDKSMCVLWPGERETDDDEITDPPPDWTKDVEWYGPLEPP